MPTVNDWTNRKGESKMQLKPTVLAYLRVMTAHLVGRIQPPPLSPLADGENLETPSERPAVGEPPLAQVG